jgi:hypothetical protein
MRKMKPAPLRVPSARINSKNDAHKWESDTSRRHRLTWDPDLWFPLELPEQGDKNRSPQKELLADASMEGMTLNAING